MTVVSIVFAILLMTLTLASTQFSPRILISFVRDRTTQWTLGVFLGTFSYCMAALPAARALPQPFVPVATVTGAMVLALVCVGWLIYFINHISQSISVNHIVDRIARETELVIEELMPDPRGPFPLKDRDEAPPTQHGNSQPALRLHPLCRHKSPCYPCSGLSRLRPFRATCWPVRAGWRSACARIKGGTGIGGTCTPFHRCLRYRSNAHDAAGCRVRNNSDRGHCLARCFLRSTIPARRLAAWISSVEL